MHHFQYRNHFTLIILIFVETGRIYGQNAEFVRWIWGGKCPNPLLLHPCTCLKSRLVLTCENLYNEREFKTITKASKGYGILGIELESVAMRFIPEDAFDGLGIKFLNIKNSTIYALSDTNRAFIGLEKSLRSLTIENSFFISQWEWSHLSNLTKLHELSVMDSMVLEIGTEFLKLSNLPLTTVQFVRTGIRWLPQTMFSSFKDLKKVSLDQNHIVGVNRTMFPRPAKKLESLGLSHNHIRHLPKDIFVDMPALKYLYLGENHLYILDEDTFNPVWKQVSIFVFNNAPLICDCRLKWITKIKNKGKSVIASCTTPSRLKGREILTLEPDELWCQMYSGYGEISITY